MLYLVVLNFNDLTAYRTGTHITQSQLDSYAKQGVTKDDIIKHFGHPPSKNEVKGNVLWTYPYQEIVQFGSNTDYNTIFEFYSGKLIKAYQSKGSGAFLSPFSN